MLVDHLAKLEKRLQAWSDAETTTPRELLMGEFCQPMFGTELVVSSGRIVDCRSGPDSALAEVDILLCRPQGPRLEVDGLSDCVLAESVVAAITVLPVLDIDTMAAAVAGARAVKALRRTALLPAGASLADAGPPEVPDEAAAAIPCYVVAFDGPAEMGLAHVWLKTAYRLQGIVEPDMPATGRERQLIASPAVDGVFVLGRGHLNFDNVPLSYFSDEARQGTFGACWSIAQIAAGSLTSLFVHLTMAAGALAGTRLDPRPYLHSLPNASVRLGN